MMNVTGHATGLDAATIAGIEDDATVTDAASITGIQNMSLTSDKTIDQSSPLLELAGELKNRIYEFAIPTNTSVITRVEQRHHTAGLLQHHHAPPPALLAVCRQIRADTLSLYYGTNDFVITDSLCQPQAIEGFVVARNAAMQMVNTVHVTHQYLVSKPRWHCARGRPVLYDMHFTITKQHGRPYLSAARSAQRRPNEQDDLAASEEGLCCYTLGRLVNESRLLKADGSGYSLFEVVCQYAKRLNDYLDVTFNNRGQPHPWSTARLRMQCNKVKSI